MRKIISLFVVLCLATGVSADTFTASIVLPAGNQVTPGEPLALEVHGVLTTDNPGNDGLSFFSVSFALAGPQAVNLGQTLILGAPADGSMDQFMRPLGFDAGFGGTAVGDALLQAGGALNTIGNNPAAEPFLEYPSAEFITFDVAHTDQLLLEGTLTLPADVAAGTYTLSLENLHANVLAAGQTPQSFGIYAVEAADTVFAGSVDLAVGGGNPADLNDDGQVDSSDLALLLGAWGPVTPCPPTIPGDINEDCAVDSSDLALLLGSWGPA